MSFPRPEWGEIFVFGYQGTRPSPEFLQLLKNYRIGGIIFFERNIPNPVALKEQVELFKQAVDYPLFFMIDQEGGRVNRIKENFPVFPGNRFYGDRDDLSGAKKAYQTTAEGLRKLGINVNLAPAADVVREESNYMSERSFGTKPERVGQFTEKAVEAIRSANIMACAKHFPGIGNLKQDPHQVLPVNKQPAKEFKKIDFIPFYSVIEQGVEMIMTTHVSCPALDEKEPVTFSEKIVTNILREELKFDGLIITDDMEMGGVANYFEITEACEKAFLAGHDLILICHSLEKQKQTLEHFEKRIKEGVISQNRVEESLSRIKGFKQKLIRNVAV